MIIIVTSSSISVDQIASGRHFSTTSIDSPTTLFFGAGSCTCPEFARLGDNQKYIRVNFVNFCFDFCFLAHHCFFGPGHSSRPEFARLGDCWKYIRVNFVIFVLIFVFVFSPTTVFFGPGCCTCPEFAILDYCWKYIGVICGIFIFDVFFCPGFTTRKYFERQGYFSNSTNNVQTIAWFGDQTLWLSFSWYFETLGWKLQLPLKMFHPGQDFVPRII